jgi:hypothetical protein
MDLLLKIRKLDLINTILMERILKNLTVKSGVKMKIQWKNGMKSGEKFTNHFRNRNGVINGKLI